MNLSNFKEQIDSTILKRGFDYYFDGHVNRISKGIDNKFECFVDGSKPYVVKLRISENDEIVDSICNCPYDFGPVCKHEVAAYYAVSDILRGREIPCKMITFENNPDLEAKIMDTLGSMSAEKMFHFIYQISTSNKEIAEQLLSKYGPKNRVEKNNNTSDPVNETLKDDYKKLSQLDLAVINLERACCNGFNGFYDFDDYEDDFGESYWHFEECIEEVDRLVSSIPKEKLSKQEQIFDRLLDLAQFDETIQENALDLAILKICLKFADDSKLRNQLLFSIDDMAERCSKYTVYTLNALSIEILELKGTSEELEMYISRNMRFPHVRKYKVKSEVLKGNYKKALELISEVEHGNKNYEASYEWRQIRYDVYKSASMITEQALLAHEMFDHGHLEFYKELKELNRKNFNTFYTGLKEDLRRKFYEQRIVTSNSRYLYVIEEEKDYEAILEVVKEAPILLERFEDMLFKTDKYNNEVADIYADYICEKARDANSRKMYAEVCRALRRFKKLAGAVRQDEVAQKLRASNKNRPAFIDELSKL